ncbi:MAG: aconitase family protein [Alphaproteobacteria bacterium]
MGQTITEKILSRVLGRAATPGEIVYPEGDWVTVHDWYIVNFDRALQDLGIDRVHDPEHMIMSTCHEPVAVSPQAALRQKQARAIAKKYGIRHHFDTSEPGHGHILPVEKGFIKPGGFVLAYDPHVTNFGAVGCLAFAMAFEISEVIALGNCWCRVPETVRVNLTGSLPDGIAIRDIAQRLIGDLDPDIIDYSVVEYGGPALADLSIDQRMILCNTPLEIGAKSSVVETDAVTFDYLRDRVEGPLNEMRSDDDAKFLASYDIDLGLLEPQVAAPPTPDNVVGVSAVAGTPIDHASIGSCAGGTLTDLRDAARLLKGRRISDHVRLFITPGTLEIAARASAEGLTEIFLNSGAMVTAPGCGTCAAGRIGPTADGEVSINTGTRNDYGRLGSETADIYLASSLTVAASAIAGKIVDPRELLQS